MSAALFMRVTQASPGATAVSGSVQRTATTLASLFDT
jgi:hypothetical protein